MKKSMDAARAAGPRRPVLRDEAPPPGLAVPVEVPDDFGKMVVDETEVPVTTAVRIGLLGSGQGGAKIAQAFWSHGYRRVGAFNTTETDFKGLAATMPKLSLDIGGAGKDMKVAHDALVRSREDVHDLMMRAWGDGVELALVCVSLGGGTGSGTGAQLIEMARRYLEERGKPPRVGAVVSLPSSGNQMVCRNAVLAFRSLVEVKASPLIIIDNGKINEIYGRPPLDELFPLANGAVARLLHLFNVEASIHSEYATFDRSELLQLLDGGITVMGESVIPVEKITGPADVGKAIRDELARNVLATVDLAKGQKAACLFVGHADVLKLFPVDYFEAGFRQLDRIVGTARTGGDPVVVHTGIYRGNEPGLQCYTMVSGLEPPHQQLAQLAKTAGLDVRSNPGLAEFLRV